MLLVDFNRIRYPDEPVTIFDDREAYEDAIKGLEVALSVPSLKESAAETIAELKRRKEQREMQK